MGDGLHALLHLVLALQRAQQRVQALVLLILYHGLVPGPDTRSPLSGVTILRAILTQKAEVQTLFIWPGAT